MVVYHRMGVSLALEGVFAFWKVFVLIKNPSYNYCSESVMHAFRPTMFSLPYCNYAFAIYTFRGPG